MHEANFELIEIPHVRQSGKNSADIRLVVDALDLCYTKAHVNTFVIISGDSDFSPLVSKLRENAKQVIGVGVKQSTSDLLIANCDEFIFYDDLVREGERMAQKRESRQSNAGNRRPQAEDKGRKDDVEARRTQAIDIAVETFEALLAERGDSGKIWASMLKEAIKRRKPDFSESYYGFRAFGNLLEEAQSRGLLEFGRDEKSGTYVYRSSNTGEAESPAERPAREAEPSRRDRSRRGGRRDSSASGATTNVPEESGTETPAEAPAEVEAAQPVVETTPARRERPPRRGARRANPDTVSTTENAAPAPAVASPTAEPPPAASTTPTATTVAPAASAPPELPRVPSNASPAALRTSEKMKAADAAIAAAAAARAAQSARPATAARAVETPAPARAVETVAPVKAVEAPAPAAEVKTPRAKKTTKAEAPAVTDATPARDKTEKPVKAARKPATRKKSAPKKDAGADDTPA